MSNLPRGYGSAAEEPSDDDDCVELILTVTVKITVEVERDPGCGYWRARRDAEHNIAKLLDELDGDVEIECTDWMEKP